MVDVGFFGRREGTRRRWSKVPYFTRDRDRNFRRAESERGSIEQQHLKTLDNLASFCQNFTTQDYIPVTRCIEGSNGKFSSRQRPPLVAVHRTEFGRKIRQNVYEFFRAVGFPMKDIISKLRNLWRKRRFRTQAPHVPRDNF